MKIIITGSLGHISKPLTELLVAKGHAVTVISSKEERRGAIESLGARAAIGSIGDTVFLTKTFSGADIVYLMEPPPNFFDPATDTEQHWTGIARTYATAVEASGVKKVVHLSSIGAHTTEGNGMLAAHHLVENILRELPAQVAIKFMRPVGFYYNMFAFIPTIKAQGLIIQNYGGEEKEPWVSPADIAEVVAEEMEQPFDGRTVRYIASEEISPNEVAKTLGEAIELPQLKWLTVSDEQFQQGLIAAGFSEKNAAGLTGMNAGRRHQLYDDYRLHQPTLGKIKLTDFAKEFAAVYHQQST
ncbi:MAG: NAD-dependent epimerase/dehydratase family protein [Ferruginibacter sp.]|nr:NAD-dependent epimerase/dehydratase family protein [Ferruginibacter sp.]